MVLHHATPLGALTVRAVHNTLHGGDTARVVKQSLRDGMRKQIITDADERSAVASVVFGTACLRARLAWMVAQAAPTGTLQLQTAATAAERRELAAALLVAAFLLHEKPQRARASVVSELLPATSLGLTSEAINCVATLDLNTMRWPSAPVPQLATRYSLPCGLARLFLRRLPSESEEAAALAAAFNTPGPVTLRANLHVLPRRESLLESLEESLGGSVTRRSGRLSPWAIHLDAAARSDWGGSVWSLGPWQRGEFEVQDEGSQCVALACEAAKGDTVLDYCAGNGGKTLALAALLGSAGRVLAHDVVEPRLAALRASAGRAGVASIVETLATGGEDGDGALGGSSDAAPNALRAASAAYAPSGFDVILVDAPCSSCGVLRRHPGLRWARGASWRGTASAAGGGRISSGELGYPSLQLRLLRHAATLVKPGGRLVYATCSLDDAENEGVARAFEEEEAESAATAEVAFAPWPFEDSVAGRHSEATHFRTLWPHRHGTDGFFIARWRRRVQ